MQARKVTITWSWEQDRQVQFLRACGLSYYIDGGGPKPPVARILLYGGSAGGGKTSALLIAGLIAAVTWPGCKVGYFRREYPQLEGPGGAIQESHQLYSAVGKWHGGQRRWTFPGGSILQFCHCKNEEDIYGYQSLQFDILLIDESTQFTEFQLRYLLTRNRATVNGITPFCAMATNPGGVSHGYHKKYFVDAGPWGQPVDVDVEGHLERHIFIPARLKDNRILEERDPGYRKTLERMPKEIREALLNGRWDIFAGQYFKAFQREKDGKLYHVISPCEIPKEWRRFASLDWGFAAPCAVLWHAINPSMGRVITYRELYVTDHRAGEVATLFLEMSKHPDGQPEEIAYVKASPDMWHERGLGKKAAPGKVIAEEFTDLGINLERADNRRVIGWTRIREYLAEAPDGLPWWQVFETCENLVRTLPECIHDKRRIEDIDSNCEDHACFIAGTMVETWEGRIPIEKIRPGQNVLTRKGFKRVEASRCNGIRSVYRVRLSTGRDLVGTADHPIWVKGKGFTPLIRLNPGDELLSKGECKVLATVKESASFAGESLELINTTKQKLVQECAVRVLDICLAGTEKIYNISVEEEPEYFANGILVHNCESLRYGLMSRPSPNEGEMFMPGAAEHYGHSKNEPDEDDFGDAEEVAGFYGV